MIDLGLTHAALEGEWWRLWTAHLVHWDAPHLFANFVAAVVPFVAATSRLRIRMLAWGAAVAPFLSLVVLGTFEGEMRGASGLAVFFWVYAGASLLRDGERRLGILLLAAIATKLVAEAVGFIQPHPGYVTLSTLHYVAAGLSFLIICIERGLTVAAAFAAARPATDA